LDALCQRAAVCGFYLPAGTVARTVWKHEVLSGADFQDMDGDYSGRCAMLTTLAIMLPGFLIVLLAWRIETCRCLHRWEAQRARWHRREQAQRAAVDARVLQVVEDYRRMQAPIEFGPQLSANDVQTLALPVAARRAA
jgi:hypothetical protein